MIPELGHFSLILALVMAALLGGVPLYGSFYGQSRLVALAKPAALAMWAYTFTAYACLTYAFVTDDFSVRYVVETSSAQLPLFYKVTGVWGAHEGSLLLWVMALASWSVAVSVFGGGVPTQVLARVLSVMGLIGAGFLLFILLTSNPFERVPMQPEGRDLNPLLQDFGLAVHPPMLYMGYVGFSVAFAFAIAAMLGGRLDAAWVRWARPWTNVAWVFLTMGIAGGSWWAYYELGWGGWWFWDPVENASLMPWLLGTALLHSLAVSEKRGLFKAWTVLLAIGAFSFSLLGTFLVRSGVLTSVHAFASDPGRGVFILLFLATVVGSSLLLFGIRAPRLATTGSFSLLSRETGLFANNLILLVMAFAVLLGTLFPLLSDALALGKISVGPPYFNTVMTPLMAALAVAMGAGLALRWRQDEARRLTRVLGLPLAVALLTAVLAPWAFGAGLPGLAVLGLAMAGWIAFGSIAWAVRLRKAPWRWSGANWGALLGHLGLAVTLTGVTLVSVYSQAADVRLEPGQSHTLAGYAFTLQGVEQTQGDNYQAYRGTMQVTRGQDRIAVLHPEKRVYNVESMPTTEAGIDPGLFRDLFVALGEPLGEQGGWSVRIQYKPFVRWLWLGGLLMALGGAAGALDKRYRRLRQTGDVVPPSAALAQGA